MPYIDWKTWKDEAPLRELIKKLYKKKGYQVEDVHGRLEPGVDLVARKLDVAGKEVIEEVGIQATIPKADKSRVENASLALTHKDLNLSYFIVIAIYGRTEDFNLHWRRSKLKDKILFKDGEALEKELLANAILPEQEFERIEEQFYQSDAFSILEYVTSSIYEKGYLPKLDLDSATEEVVRNKKLVMENLRLLTRGLQGASASSGHIYLSMSDALSQNRLDNFVDLFVEGRTIILKPLTKMKRAFQSLEKIPPAMKLIFGSLSTTERAFLIEGGKKRTDELWIFTYFDPETIYEHGHRVVLLQIFRGLQDRTNEIKTRVEKVIRLLGDENLTKKELEISISRFPMEKSDT